MSDFAKLGEFAIPFAYAAVKLRKAHDANEGADFTADEIHALFDALRMLSEGTDTDD
jgi:hypothetical protein